MEQDSVKNRLIKYLNFKGISKSEFGRSIGVSNAYITSMRKSIQPDKLKAISESYGDLNTNWLLTGEGNMLMNGQDSFQVPTGLYYEDDIPERYMTHLVPMAAMGGGLIGFEEEGIRREDCERVISPIAGADWAIPVYGDSMEPEYPNGSRVFVRQINPGDFIAWGNVFVLDTTNGLIIKVVIESERKDCVRCVSLNPSGRYQPFDVPKRTIRAMYRVMACISAK